MGAIKSKKKAELKVQIEEFNSSLQIALLGCIQAKKTFVTLSEIWCSSRGEALCTLRLVASEVEKHRRNVAVASMTGTSSSIAGGTAAIGGVLASPFSGGLSLALSAGGILGTVAGTATTLGANFVEVFLTKELTERASKVLETDVFYTKSLRAAFREVILHEQEVLALLAELKNEALLLDLEMLLKSSSCCDELKKRFLHLRGGSNSFQDVLYLIKNLYSDDIEFLLQLHKTDNMFRESPTISQAISSSTEFFQAVKELATLAPETLKGISEAALQGAITSSAQTASLITQVVAVGLGAVFVALDIYQFIRMSRDFDQGSRAALAEKMHSVANQLEKEKQQIEKLNSFYRKQVHADAFKELS